MLGFVANSLGFAGILTGPAGNWEKLGICWEKLRICWEKFRIGWEKLRCVGQSCHVLGFLGDPVKSVGILPVITGSAHARKVIRFLRFCLGCHRIACVFLGFLYKVSVDLAGILFVPSTVEETPITKKNPKAESLKKTLARI